MEKHTYRVVFVVLFAAAMLGLAGPALAGPLGM